MAGAHGVCLFAGGAERAVPRHRAHALVAEHQLQVPPPVSARHAAGQHAHPGPAHPCHQHNCVSDIQQYSY